MFADPEKNIAQFDLREGARIADFGSGSGRYALVAAKALQNSGKVYAVEVQKELLDRIKKEADEAKLNNLEIVWGDIEAPNGSRLRDGSIDAVIISNVLFQIKDKPAVISEAARVLGPGGRVLCIDWSESYGGMGPQQKDILVESVAKELFQDAGFSIQKEIDAGEHHYGFVAVK